MNKKTPTLDPLLRWLAISIGLVLVGGVADVLDGICYMRFARANGFGWFQLMPWGLTWQYLSSYPGNILTIMGVIPYLLMWAGFRFLARNLDTDDNEFGHEKRVEPPYPAPRN
ncbi:hypothetical protein OAK85_05160 [Mariniblastus sp.]|nr:hypothetical protein [Mariniblastus sp.]MDC0284725.1 hypothetical protein [Mariniblastus sp.]